MAEVQVSWKNANKIIISLDEVLPKDWRLCKYYDYRGGEDECDKAIKSAIKTDSIKYKYISEDDVLYHKITHKIRRMQEKRHDEALKIVGLDTDSLDKACDEVEENTTIKGDLHLPQFYAPILSFIRTYLGFKGRKIVEVGPGNDGEDMLAYMASKGADVIGLDRIKPRGGKRVYVESIEDRWENIASHVNSADVIYVVYMHPNPEEDGEFRCRDIGPNSIESMKGSKRKFEEHIAKEMAKALKPGGIFMINYLPDDEYTQYTIRNSDVFEDNGFKEHLFYSGHWISHSVHVMQKKQ